MNQLWVVLLLSFVLDLSLTLVLAVPIWLLWTACGLSGYFLFLPSAWLSLPFLHVVGLLLLVTLLKYGCQGVKMTVKA